MNKDNEEALKCADGVERMDTFTEYQRAELKKSAAHLRRLVAENEVLRRKFNAYMTLDKAQTEELSTLRARQEKFREAAATLQSERDANAVLTAENEAKDVLLRQALEALKTGQIRSVSEWEVIDVTPKVVRGAITAIRQHLEGRA